MESSGVEELTLAAMADGNRMLDGETRRAAFHTPVAVLQSLPIT